MKRIITSILRSAVLGASFFARPMSAAAAETEPNESENIDKIQDQHENEEQVEVVYNTGNMAGDQNLRIALGGSFPLSFGNPFTDDGKMKPGGMACLGYHYFLTPEISVGADATFGFNVTLGGNIFNCVPILATVTYTPHIKNFEIPITLGIGMAWEMYNGKTYWPGLAIKPEIGLNYRLSADWSVGGEISYLWLPQFNRLYSGKENKHAQFVTISASARYYF